MEAGTRRFWIAWALTLGVTLLVLALVWLPPFVGPRLRLAIMQGFSPFCHQLPGRSLQVGGIPLAVCHRCLGIYTGLPLAVGLFVVLLPFDALIDRYAGWIVAASLLPIAVDWGLDYLGLWTNTPLSRELTGGVFGVVAGLYLARAMVRLFSSRRRVLREEPA